MSKWVANLYTAVKAAVLVTVAVAVWLVAADVRKLVKQTAQDEAANSQQSVIALNTVNAPCRDNGHQVVCGTLAEIGQTTKNTGILAAQGAEQVKQSGALIAATTRNMDAVGSALTEEIASLKGITDSVPDLTRSASQLLGTANDTVAAGKPVLGAATAFLDHADAVVSNSDIPKLVANGQTITYNLGQTTGDFQKKFHSFLYPEPCTTFGCRLKRTWPYVKGVTEMAQPGYFLQQSIENRVP